mmetsp:Transcript_9640/g.21434  ORF Transcript_9640/g.21434 Transcript_9640/m.21434 type:complete len:122 (-) Transcript_9640:538-903(-)
MSISDMAQALSLQQQWQTPRHLTRQCVRVVIMDELGLLERLPRLSGEFMLEFLPESCERLLMRGDGTDMERPKEFRERGGTAAMASLSFSTTFAECPSCAAFNGVSVPWPLTVTLLVGSAP